MGESKGWVYKNMGNPELRKTKTNISPLAKKQTNNQGFYFNISNKTTEVSRPNSLKKGWHRVNPKKIRVLKYGSKYVHHKFASFTINIYRHKSVKTYKTYSND